MGTAKLALLMTLSLVFGAASVEADVVVSTLPQWNGTDSVGGWGLNHDAAFGETLIAPTGTNQLNNVRFEVSNTDLPISYQSYVFAWNGTNAVGTPLYTSPLSTVPVSSGFQAVTMTPDVPVVAGQQYVAFLFVEPSGPPTYSYFGYSTTSNVGNAVYAGNYQVVSQLTSAPWACNPDNCGLNALAFSADFANVSAVPVPASALLIMSGLSGLAIFSRKRKLR